MKPTHSFQAANTNDGNHVLGDICLSPFAEHVDTMLAFLDMSGNVKQHACDAVFRQSWLETGCVRQLAVIRRQYKAYYTSLDADVGARA